MQFCCGSLRQRDQELLVSSENNRKEHFVAVKSRGQPPGQDKKESSGKDAHSSCTPTPQLRLAKGSGVCTRVSVAIHCAGTKVSRSLQPWGLL